jgi:glycosyltransferase involved in cell wall biosynthesis
MSRRLRIAQIAPVGTAVHRRAGESVEQLVAVLCDELVARGHEVTLFATGDSETAAELRFTFARGYEHDPDMWDWQFPESMHVGAAYAHADEFDVIHCHSYHYGVPFASMVHTANVHTHHVEMDPAVIAAYAKLPRVQLVAISRFQASRYSGCSNVELIPHGIDTDSFPSGDGSGGYLLFLGRMIEDKGPLEAIEIARAADMPLILAGPAEDGFDERVAPHVDGEQVRHVGRVAPAARNRLLAGAAALVYPLLYPEPFGLVPVEAMACGTPVVATGIGAVPELVEPGLTGCLGDSWEDLAALVPAAMALDRGRIRERTVERFGHQRMVDRHEALYQRLTSRSGREGRRDAGRRTEPEAVAR